MHFYEVAKKIGKMEGSGGGGGWGGGGGGGGMGGRVETQALLSAGVRSNRDVGDRTRVHLELVYEYHKPHTCILYCFPFLLSGLMGCPCYLSIHQLQVEWPHI